MIKLLTSIAGEGFSYQYGEIVNLDAKTEKALIKSGQAEKVAKSETKSKATSKK